MHTMQGMVKELLYEVRKIKTAMHDSLNFSNPSTSVPLTTIIARARALKY
jgi:hypothetical protein